MDLQIWKTFRKHLNGVSLQRSKWHELFDFQLLTDVHKPRINVYIFQEKLCMQSSDQILLEGETGVCPCRAGQSPVCAYPRGWEKKLFFYVSLILHEKTSEELDVLVSFLFRIPEFQSCQITSFLVHLWAWELSLNNSLEAGHTDNAKRQYNLGTNPASTRLEDSQTLLVCHRFP